MGPGRRERSLTLWLTLTILFLTFLAWSLAPGPFRPVARLSSAEDAAQGCQSVPTARAAPVHLLSATRAPADPTLTWTELSPSRMPAQRVDSGMVFDSTDGYVLLFGGYAYGSSPAVYYNDTWTFSGGTWTNVTNLHAPAPSPRSEFELADDPADHEVVLFGGFSAKDSHLNDTWTYSAGVWTNITGTVGTSPPSTVWGSMAYDNQTESVILFGGLQGLTPSTEYTNETWSFHDNKWVELFPATSPPARNSASLVDDVSDGDLLLFGGQNDTEDFDDTWIFSGTDWIELSPSLSPPASWGAGLAYYAAQSEVVQFGGSPGGEYDTYTFHAEAWSQYDPTPNPGQLIGITQMVYDYADQYVLLYGDSLSEVSSTWTLSLEAGPPPPALNVVADATPQRGPVPLQTTFTSNISGGIPPYAVTWNFNDSTPVVTGDPGTAGNTSHTYEKVGQYNATLTVVDSAENTVVKNWTITVTTAPLTLKIAATPTSATVNQSVTFTSAPAGGSPPYTFAWTFGDGGTATTRNATHAYTSTGTYTAELVVKDQTGTPVSQNVTITVTSAPRSSSGSSSDWWVYAVGAMVVVLVVILIVVWFRRRRQKSPPAPPPLNPPTGPVGPGR